MMQTEVGEASEPFAPNRGSSSTMPQKRNPMAALLTAMDEDHDRATGPWEIEWITLPSIFTLAAGALNQAVFVLKGLEVHPDRMRANLDATHGLIVSEAVMMGLAPALGRDEAHDLVYDLCRKSLEQDRPLADLLAEGQTVMAHYLETIFKH